MIDGDPILKLAEKEGVGPLPEGVMAAIRTINSTASVDRQDPRALAAHNAAVVAAHRIIQAWETSASIEQERKREAFRQAVLDEGSASTRSPAAYENVVPGREGHTNPIPPTVGGTGLGGQEKPPKYDEDGNLA